MRFGIDLGGTKIEIMALGDDGAELYRHRVPTPQSGYEDTVRALANEVLTAEQTLNLKGTVGICIPGSLSPKTGLVKNANQTKLIGHPLDKDLGAMLKRPVRVENDARCFTLSEASDGAAAGYHIVFGVIIGTGVGGGVCVGGKVLRGANAIAGEWGHNYLPNPTDEERAHAPRCNCGRLGDIESWCGGYGFARQYKEHTGKELSTREIYEALLAGDPAAKAELEKYSDRFARALGAVVSILDPDVIVLGGGLSNIAPLYDILPELVSKYAFNPEGPTNIVKNKHGDSSGVRGAAWLWHPDEVAGALPK